MKLMKNEWLRDSGRQMRKNPVGVVLIAIGLLGMALVQMAGAQAVNTTTVQGTVYLANGHAGSGTLHISWPGFTTANGQAVAADSTNVTIAADGFVSVNLAPNMGATPAGLYYTAVFYMSDGTTSTQYWVVPSAAQASLAQVQSQLMPAAQAVQAVSKAYVDQSISELNQSLLTASGGTLTGPLYLSADPTQALQAADKHYVDTALSQAVPLAGGSMTGALNTPAVNGVQAPTASSSQTTLQAAMTAAGTNGAMEIPPTYAGTDGFTNPNGVPVTDLRTSGAQQAERSVKEFGAVCDGMTDDTNALQTALNYAQAHGVALTIPQGTCKTRSLNWHGESIGGMGKQVSALMGFPGQDVLASVTDSANLLGYTRIHDLTIYVDQSLDVSCSAVEGRVPAGSCTVNRPLESDSIFSRGGNGLTGTTGTGAGWAAGNCAIAMPAVTGMGGNGLRVAEIENVEIATTGVDPMAAQYAGARSTHTCGMYLAQWPQWSEFRNIDIRGLNTGIAIPPLPGTPPAGLNADSNRWQNITIQATHGFTAATGSNNVLDNVVAMAGNSAATGEPPTGLVLDFAGTQQGWTIRNAVVLPSWNAVQPQLAVTASGGAVTGVTVGSEHGLGFDPYGAQVPLQFSGSCTASATANVNSDGSIGTISVTQGGVGCSGTTTAKVNVAGTWDTAAAVNLIGGQNMTFFAGNLLKGTGGYTVWNATASESYGTQLTGGGGTLPGGGNYQALVANNAGTGRVMIGSGGANASTVATIDNAGNAQFNGALQVGGTSTFSGSTTVRNQADAEIDQLLWAGATASQKESLTYKDWNGNSQWYAEKDASNNWELNSATGGLDSFKAYQSTNTGDTYINASNGSGVVRVNYETGAGTGFKVYGGSSSSLYASFTGTTSIQFPGLAASNSQNCLQIDNSGYVTNTGLACGTGSSSGTVNSGNSGQIAYYTSTGTSIGGMTTIPLTAGGTGAATAAGALQNLGGISSTATYQQTMDGPLNVTSTVAAGGVTLPAGAPSGTVGGQTFYSPHTWQSVRTFGAKGDGTTDDTAAIQGAITAAGSTATNCPNWGCGGVAYLPSGTYVISAPLRLPSGVRMEGDSEGLGTIVLLKPSTTVQFMVGPQYFCPVDACPSGGNEYTYIDHIFFDANAQHSSHVTDAVIDMQAVYNNSAVTNSQVWDYTGGAGIWIGPGTSGDGAGALLLENIWINDGQASSPGIPILITDWYGSYTAGHIEGISVHHVQMENMGAQPAIKIQSHAPTQMRNNTFDDVWIAGFTGDGVVIDGLSYSRFSSIQCYGATANTSCIHLVTPTLGSSTYGNSFRSIWTSQTGGPGYPAILDANTPLSYQSPYTSQPFVGIYEEGQYNQDNRIFGAVDGPFEVGGSIDQLGNSAIYPYANFIAYGSFPKTGTSTWQNSAAFGSSVNGTDYNSWLQLWTMYLPSNTAASRMLGLQGEETNVGARNISLQPLGGYVGIGSLAPIDVFQVHAGTNENLGIQAAGFATGVELNAYNDSGGNNVAMQFQATQFQWGNGTWNFNINTTGDFGNANGTLLPHTLTGSHGSSGTSVQLSDGTGTSGNLAKFASDGSVTNGPAPPSGTIVGATDTQTLTNKSIAGSEINSGAVGPAYGGTGQNESSATGIGQWSSGTYSVATSLPGGTTATTQSAGDNSTKVATTAYVASPGAIAPTTVTASGIITGANDTTRVTTTTMTNSWTTTGLVLPTVPVNTTKTGRCVVLWAMSSTSYTATFGIGMSNAPTGLWGGSSVTYAGAGTSNWLAFSQTSTSTTAVSTAATAGATGTIYRAEVDFTIQTGGTNPVAVTLFGETGNSSATLTIEPGSTCYWLP